MKSLISSLKSNNKAFSTANGNYEDNPVDVKSLVTKTYAIDTSSAIKTPSNVKTKIFSVPFNDLFVGDELEKLVRNKDVCGVFIIETILQTDSETKTTRDSLQCQGGYFMHYPYIVPNVYYNCFALPESKPGPAYHRTLALWAPGLDGDLEVFYQALSVGLNPSNIELYITFVPICTDGFGYLQ